MDTSFNPTHHPTPDAENARFVADLIRVRASDIADIAAASLLKSHPHIASHFRPQPHYKWREQLEGRLHDLASAVAAEAPEIFAAQVEWSRVAFHAREVPTTHLINSLTVLHTTLATELPQEDRSLIHHYFHSALARISGQTIPPPTTLSVKTRAGKLAAQYLVAILEGDRARATRAVLDAVNHPDSAHKISIHDAYLEVLVPAQRELGRMWHVGELSIAEEHFATITTRRMMAQLVASATHAPPNGYTLLAAAVEGNTHDLGVTILADFFELAGWRVIELGASIPVAEFASAAADFLVDVVAISATIPSQLTTVADTIAAIKDVLGADAPRIIVGGQAFGSCPDLWKSMGADGYCNSASEAVTLAHTLLDAHGKTSAQGRRSRL